MSLKADDIKVGEEYAYGRAYYGGVCGRVRIEAEATREVKGRSWEPVRTERGWRVTYLTSYSNDVNREGFLARRSVSHDIISTWAEHLAARERDAKARSERDHAQAVNEAADQELRGALALAGVWVTGGHEDGGVRPFTITREELVKLLARLQAKE